MVMSMFLSNVLYREVMGRLAAATTIMLIFRLGALQASAVPAGCTWVGTELSCRGRTQVPPYNPHYLNITKLDLATNRITALTSTSFSGYQNSATLVHLLLDNNPLPFSGLAETAFAKAGSLSEISITNCSLGAIDRAIFSLSSLTTLNLGSSMITSLSGNAFKGATGLTTLQLDNNQIVILPANLFSDNHQLTTLRLDRNNITTIQPDVFQGLNFLNHLNIEYNKISIIDQYHFPKKADLDLVISINSVSDEKLLCYLYNYDTYKNNTRDAGINYTTCVAASCDDVKQYACPGEANCRGNAIDYTCKIDEEHSRGIPTSTIIGAAIACIIALGVCIAVGLFLCVKRAGGESISLTVKTSSEGLQHVGKEQPAHGGKFIQLATSSPTTDRRQNRVVHTFSSQAYLHDEDGIFKWRGTCSRALEGSMSTATNITHHSVVIPGKEGLRKDASQQNDNQANYLDLKRQCVDVRDEFGANAQVGHEKFEVRSSVGKITPCRHGDMSLEAAGTPVETSVDDTFGVSDDGHAHNVASQTDGKYSLQGHCNKILRYDAIGLAEYRYAEGRDLPDMLHSPGGTNGDAYRPCASVRAARSEQNAIAKNNMKGRLSAAMSLQHANLQEDINDDVFMERLGPGKSLDHASSHKIFCSAESIGVAV